MRPQIILLQPAAPAKPPPGAACNGCGACCATEPCPVGMLRSLRRRGACRQLRWDEASSRYHCGLMADGAPRWLRRLAARWIAAGIGCDADLELAPVPGTDDDTGLGRAAVAARTSHASRAQAT